MSYFFDFESDMERSLALIPIAVRFKLDKCGIKLSLAQWQLLPYGNRLNLLQAKCDSVAEIAQYRPALCRLIEATTGDAPTVLDGSERQWEDADLPEQIRTKTADLGVSLPSAFGWRRLVPVQRFALLKLSRSAQSHEKFVPALREFGLL